MMHTKDEIDQFLRKAFFAVLTYNTSDGLISQLLVFGHTVEGDFFLFSENEKEIFKSIETGKDVSILIYKEEEELGDIRQLNILGKATIIEGFDSDEAKLGYEVLGEKSPLIGNSPLDIEKQPYCTLIKVEAQSISYITFEELKQHNSPTTLKRV